MLWSHTFDSPPGQISLISIAVHTRRGQHSPALQFCSTLNTTLFTCDWLPRLCRFSWVPAGQPWGSWAWLWKGPCAWVCTSIWLISRTRPYKRQTLMTILCCVKHKVPQITLHDLYCFLHYSVTFLCNQNYDFPANTCWARFTPKIYIMSPTTTELA